MSHPDPAKASAEDLLRRVATRDHAAFAALYDQVAGLLFSNAVHILGDRREAEEVVQDVFLQMWNKAEAFESELGSAISWMLAITRNRCIDRLRSRQRRARVFDEGVEQTSMDAASADAPLAGAIGPDEIAAIRLAVAELPADQQQAVAMAFFGAMTHQEISEALQEPLGTVKARIRRGLLRLSDRLKPYV